MLIFAKYHTNYESLLWVSINPAWCAPAGQQAASPGQSDQKGASPWVWKPPEGAPLEGAKAKSVCFLLLPIQGERPCGLFTQGVGSPCGSPCPGLVACCPVGA